MTSSWRIDSSRLRKGKIVLFFLRFLMLAGALVAVLPSPARASEYSLDCQKPIEAIDVATCRDPQARELYATINELFRQVDQLSNHRPGLIDEQARWMKSREQFCPAGQSYGSYHVCLLDIEPTRIKVLQAIIQNYHEGKTEVESNSLVREPMKKVLKCIHASVQDSRKKGLGEPDKISGVAQGDCKFNFWWDLYLLGYGDAAERKFKEFVEAELSAQRQPR